MATPATVCSTGLSVTLIVAKTASTDATVAPEHLGFMSLTPGKTDITMRLLINIGTQTGVGVNELLSQEIGINE